MPVFAYRGLGADGRSVNGVVDADSARTARGKLRASGIFPTDLNEESNAAQRSAATQALQSEVADLRAHAGLTTLRGPGVQVDLANGVPGPDQGGQTGYLVNFQDVQDIANLLFAQGAEGVSVNGRRITPLSAFSGSAGQVVIDQGPPISSPLKVLAVGDRNRMEAALNDPSAVPDIRAREVQFQLQIHFIGNPDLTLPAYDSSLEIPHVITG